MQAPRYKWISANQAQIDKEYSGYKVFTEPDSIHLCHLIYKGNNTAWLFGDEKFTQTNISFVKQELTWKEIEDWYKNYFDISNPKNKNNLFGLFTDLYDVGDASHEMWNGWIEMDWYAMSAGLQDEDFYLIGIAEPPWGKTYLDEPTVAFVCETYDGTRRFWSHGSKNSLLDMREQMEKIYDELKKELDK